MVKCKYHLPSEVIRLLKISTLSQGVTRTRFTLLPETTKKLDKIYERIIFQNIKLQMGSDSWDMRKKQGKPKLPRLLPGQFSGHNAKRYNRGKVHKASWDEVLKLERAAQKNKSLKSSAKYRLAHVYKERTQVTKRIIETIRGNNIWHLLRLGIIWILTSCKSWGIEQSLQKSFASVMGQNYLYTNGCWVPPNKNLTAQFERIKLFPNNLTVPQNKVQKMFIGIQKYSTSNKEKFTNV